VDDGNQMLAIDPFGFENQSSRADDDITPDYQIHPAYNKPPMLQVSRLPVSLTFTS